MGKAKKATKKFLQKKATGKIRKNHKKPEWKQKQKSNDDDGTSSDDEQQQQNNGDIDIANMDMDEFLAGDFLSSDKSFKNNDDDSEDDDDDDDSILSDDNDLGIDDDDDDQLDQQPDINEDEDEDEEDDDNNDGGVHAQNKKLGSEIQQHRKQLEKLKHSDPEFYEYLQATDQELLHFGEDDDEEDDDSEGDGSDDSDSNDSDDDIKKTKQDDVDDDEDEDDHEQPTTTTTTDKTVTMSLVQSWSTSAQQGSLNALRNLIRAFRVACHYGDTEENIDEGLRIGSSAVYNTLMMFVLKEADGMFKNALRGGSGGDGDKNVDDVLNGKLESISALTRLTRWKKVEPLVKSYLGNTLHLLSNMTDGTMLAFILRRIRPSVAFLAPFAKIQRRYLKSSLSIFGSSPDDAPRVQAILLIRAMAITLPPPAIDSCLKGVYRTYFANAKFVNAASAPHINFMASCVVELYGMDAAASYRAAFGFIRQLAVLMRQALTAKSKESYRQVYCWQTMNCLEVWAKVLAAHADMTELRPLIYPVAQLLLGAARLVPTPAYFPLRLRCARALNVLARATGVYIPVSTVLLEILQWSDLGKSPKASNPGEKIPEVLLQLRASKNGMRSSVYQEEIVEQVLELLADHLAQWACHCAFPELAHMPIIYLKKFAKTTKVDRFRRSTKQLVDAIERNITFVGKKRDDVDFSPKDLTEVSLFLSKEAAAGTAPVVQHAKTLQQRAQQRYEMRAAREVAVGAELPGSKKVDLQKNDDDNSDGEYEHLNKKNRAKAEKKKKAVEDQLQHQLQQQKQLQQDGKGGSDDDDDFDGGDDSGDSDYGFDVDDGMNEDDEDRVEAYQLSDDDDDDDVIVNKKRKTSRGGGNDKKKNKKK